MRIPSLALGLAMSCAHGETAHPPKSPAPPTYEQASKERPPHPTNKLAHAIVDALTALPTPVECHIVRTQVERVLAALGAERQSAEKCPDCEVNYLLPDGETAVSFAISPAVASERPGIFRVSVQKSGTKSDPPGVLNAHIFKLCREVATSVGGNGI